MNLFICLDEKNGMMFNKRRQSRDSVVCQKIIELSKDKKLFMTEYSSKIFENGDISISPDPENSAIHGDFVFCENGVKSLENVEKLYVFLWNRRYPADVFFGFDIESEGFSLCSTEEFQGLSHEKITLNIYRRNQ